MWHLLLLTALVILTKWHKSGQSVQHSRESDDSRGVRVRQLLETSLRPVLQKMISTNDKRLVCVEWTMAASKQMARLQSLLRARQGSAMHLVVICLDVRVYELLQAIKYPLAIACFEDPSECLVQVDRMIVDESVPSRYVHPRFMTLSDANVDIETHSCPLTMETIRQIIKYIDETDPVAPLLQLVDVDTRVDPARTIVPFLWTMANLFQSITVR
jgi:hypothetical protein